MASSVSAIGSKDSAPVKKTTPMSYTDQAPLHAKPQKAKKPNSIFALGGATMM